MTDQIEQTSQIESDTRPSDRVADTLPDVDLTPVGAPASAKPSPDDVMEAMKDVVDPELGINVVDLGLVYGVTINDDNSATLDMTLTLPTCPLTDEIEDQTNAAVDGLVSSIAINWVWIPQWDMSMITEDGRDQLRALGYNI
jgi:metal-sulfur cluster biosynthetic enzyme